MAAVDPVAVHTHMPDDQTLNLSRAAAPDDRTDKEYNLLFLSFISIGVRQKQADGRSYACVRKGRAHGWIVFGNSIQRSIQLSDFTVRVPGPKTIFRKSLGEASPFTSSAEKLATSPLRGAQTELRQASEYRNKQQAVAFL